jgi:hypothetical protein
MMNSSVDHENFRARAFDAAPLFGHSAREGRSRTVKHKDDQPNSTLGGIIFRHCDTKPQNRPARGRKVVENLSRPQKKAAVSPGRGINRRRRPVKQTYPQAHKGRNPVADSEQRLHSILVTLEECRAGLIDNGNRETARFVGVAILDIRMRLNRIGDSELKALCDAMLADDPPAETEPSPEAERRPLLKLVK